jgi:hypothetical protein
MFSLLSSQEQQHKNESQRSRRDKIRNGIKLTLSHFKEPVFPRTISSTDSHYGPKFKIVYSENEMLKAYENSNFIDCRVSVNPPLNNSKEIDTASADLITFDLEKSVFMRESAQIKMLYAILHAFRKMLLRPTVLWSGNSFSIYQPIGSTPIHQIEIFRDHVIKQYPLLGFLEQDFVSYESDPYHVNSMLMIAGTLNSKCVVKSKDGEEQYQEVEIVQTWDGHIRKIDSSIYQYFRNPNPI